MYPTDVVVTGLGCASALGNNSEQMWQSLIAGYTGIKPLVQHDPLACEQVHLLAKCQQLEFLSGHMDKWPLTQKQLRQMSTVSKMLCHSALNALDQAKLSYDDIANNLKVGTIIGAGVNLCEEQTKLLPAQRNPNWLLQTYPNIHLAHLSRVLGLTGFATTIVNACTSASQAIGQGMQMIRAGLLDIALVGGADSRISPAFLSGFSRLNMLSKGADLEQGMRPFDQHRDGFVLGEGAGVLILESAQHASQRGAKPLAQVLGFGCSQDAYRLTEPCPQGKARAMALALQDASINVRDIGYINAHGTATQQNDYAETLAIQQIFGSLTPWVNSSKGFLGHSLAASGALEAIVCIKSLQQQMLHPNRPFTQSKDTPPLTLVGEQAISCKLNFSLSNSSAIGGTNTSLVFKRIEK
ncbi:beta-ketoacyl-[acyl-carrier-protein] synthase family protein [Motilimonas sp. 1_MG-2023]|uniref:beta-ketoacyl-[acyl-carrier-protein] synthase family protein n=1 Tax=Motilimonas sp. 1_MG-2023 TaxID=3062672 RepID=UPI0026E45B5A|nr:beta-ketoacyl-[acyl-carrier-protein] synthase family protein [Motilimonas sp. 1_MG-2023]MDO6525549.1 beta-ketoacyl-[acyl-carrier-protein] synthase family protein [Motilimonas sp. 1_MG-2023]